VVSDIFFLFFFDFKTMGLKTIAVDMHIYRCLREECLPAGTETKLQVDGVISIRLPSATNGLLAGQLDIGECKRFDGKIYRTLRKQCPF